jgi:methylmalonyl-CoA/ethylmalonyl-CoA epimerase
MADLKKLDHVAVLVEDLEQALSFWQEALGLELDHVEEVESQEAKVAFLPLGETEIELVQPTASDSGLSRYLEKRGGGLHHLCFAVEDVAQKLGELQGKGVDLINKDPLRLDDGRQIAFIHPKSTGGVLIELVQGRE